MSFSSSLRLLALALTSVTCSGARIGRANVGLPVVDVTKIVATKKFEKSGYRCCCDKRKSWKDDMRGGIKTGFCSVAKTKKCGGVKVFESTTKAHNYKDTDGKCDIHVDDAEQFFEVHGSSEDYCPKSVLFTTESGDIQMHPGRLGQEVPYSCPAGWELKAGTAGTVKCEFNTGKFGLWSRPMCTKIAPAPAAEEAFATEPAATDGEAEDAEADEEDDDALPAKSSARSGGNKGPHKCTIQWEVYERGVAAVSFPVKSCRIGCKRTNSDNSYNRKFAEGFAVQQSGKSCECKERETGQAVIKFVGDCGADGEARCFDDYKLLRTDSYVRLNNRSSTTVVHNMHLYHERTFDYSVCEQDACPDGDCYESNFPSILSGRGVEEKAALAALLKLVSNGQAGDLKGDDRKIVDALTDDDISEIMFGEVVKSSSGKSSGSDVPTLAKTMTVGELREIYTEKLIGTAINVDSLLNMAGLTNADDIVDYEKFQKFLKPDCDQ